MVKNALFRIRKNKRVPPDFRANSLHYRFCAWRCNAIKRGLRTDVFHGNSQRALLRVYVAQFRTEYGRFINDPWWARQLAELNQISPKFRELWARHDVVNVSEGQKMIHHSLVGELIFDFLWFQTVDSRDLRLPIHTPRPNSGTADKIEQLLAVQSDTP